MIFFIHLRHYSGFRLDCLAMSLLVYRKGSVRGILYQVLTKLAQQMVVIDWLVSNPAAALTSGAGERRTHAGCSRCR